MRARLCILFYLVILVAFCLLGCSNDYNDDRFFVGEPVDPNEISIVPPESTTSITINENTPVWWTVGGSKVHLRSDCHALAKSAPENIKSGIFSDAFLENKSSICSYCLKAFGIEDEFLLPTKTEKPETSIPDVPNDTVTVTNEEETTPDITTYLIDESTLFYWTKNGGKVHLYATCSYIAGSKEILSGKEYDIPGEKTGYCSRCIKTAGIDESLLPPI